MRRINDIEQNRERLAALGKMAAGLAHELNNPAAAAQRAADQLAAALAVINYALRAFVEAGVERAEAEQLLALHQQAMDGRGARTRRSTRSTPPTPRTPCTTRSRTSACREPWELAEPLAAAGVDVGVARARSPRSRGRRRRRR